MRQFRAAVEAEPGNPMALSVLAFQAIATGDEPAARKWFERVRDQPRIERDKVENLRQLYYKQFGKSPP